MDFLDDFLGKLGMRLREKHLHVEASEGLLPRWISVFLFLEFMREFMKNGYKQTSIFIDPWKFGIEDEGKLPSDEGIHLALFTVLSTAAL